MDKALAYYAKGLGLISPVAKPKRNVLLRVLGRRDDPVAMIALCSVSPCCRKYVLATLSVIG